MHTIHRLCRDCIGQNLLQVSIIRGKDGFGFTICSDCPVRVQAVDSGGPAHQSGLRQGDSVLQLNGLPVETWKCADLAQAIRSCPSQVVLVVWRGSPELGLACKTLLRPQVYPSETRNKLLSHPTLSKHRGRWGQGGLWSGSVLRSGLGSLRRDRKENQDEMDNQETFSTVKGTRVTSSNGDNFIILSPVNHAGQPPQPVYRDREGTMGRLCQTRPSRAHNQIGTEQSTTLPLSQSRTVALGPAGNHGNYQNCTIIQSHLQQSGYGNYNSLPPKTLIFPVFVKPLDLCSPDRTIRMSEEMILHQDDLLPSKVLVLIYSDLLLITREEEAGRCNVLQSPLYLNTLQLREVPAEPLHIYVLQRSGRSWTCVFSLEAFSIEQKVRVSLCLHDNKQHHLVTMETTVPYQFTDLPPDYGLLSVGRPSSPYCRPPSFISTLTPIPFSIDPPTSFPSTFPFTCPPAPPPLPAYISPPSSSSTLRSPVWKMRGDREEMWMRRRQEEEERQQGEGESSSEASESVGGGGAPGLLLSPPDFNMDDEEDDSEEEEEELEFECRPAALRRSLSEGSLLREPRSPHFFSDSTIHYLRHTSTFDPSPFSGPPSPQTVRKQLTKEGASLHHMLLLLYGSKREKSRTIKTNKKKNKNLAADLQRRLSFLPKRKTFSGLHGNSLEKALRNTRPPEQEVRRWAGSLQALLTNKYGLAVFRHFLRSEFSEENLDFWLAVEKFKRTRPFSKMAAQAEKIYSEFISPSASRQINMDSFVRDSTSYSLTFDLSPSSFQLAQDQIFSLMETDSYSRFLRSRVYAQLTNQNTDTAVELSNQRRSVS